MVPLRLVSGTATGQSCAKFRRHIAAPGRDVACRRCDVVGTPHRGEDSRPVRL